MQPIGGTHETRPETVAAKREIVERVEEYLRAHMDQPAPLSRICRLLGVSERGLRNAFYDVRGMSPTRSMRAERLRDVRRVLSDPATSASTVTCVAAAYGFYELGRFAGVYRRAFGEAPSETLRGRVRHRLRTGHPTRKGHDNARTS